MSHIMSHAVESSFLTSGHINVYVILYVIMYIYSVYIRRTALICQSQSPSHDLRNLWAALVDSIKRTGEHQHQQLF